MSSKQVKESSVTYRKFRILGWLISSVGILALAIAFPFIRNYYTILDLQERGALIETEPGFLLEVLPEEWRYWVEEKMDSKTILAFERVNGIDMSGMDVSDSDLRQLKAFPQLYKLYLSSPYDGYFFQEMQRLEDDFGVPREVVGKPTPTPKNRVTDDGIRHLKDLKKIEFLVLDGSEITDQALENLSGMKNLYGLSLNHTSITGKGLKHLAHLSNLYELYLDDSKITDPYLQEILRFKNLENLSLRKNNISGSGFDKFRTHPVLGILSVRFCPVTNEGLANISQIKNLQELDVKYTRITDEGLDAISNMCSLLYLSINGVNESDPRIHQLGCVPVTPEETEDDSQGTMTPFSQTLRSGPPPRPVLRFPEVGTRYRGKPPSGGGFF